LKKRKFGKTGEELSIIGPGGFHLLEISDRDAAEIINAYLDRGGNYIETAPEYGAGESERKVGIGLRGRRNECFLTTKSHLRDKAGAEKSIEESLRKLHTDHVDLLILHHVQKLEELEQIFNPGGAMEAFLEAKKEGKTRYIGISGHGLPLALTEAVKSKTGLDAVMTIFNFFDRFNFPDIEGDLLPAARSRGLGIIGMKAFADGLLWEYPEQSLCYALSLPIDTMVCGFNTMEMLEKDMKIAENFKPLSQNEIEAIYAQNPVLGNYICRLCNKCLPCPENINIPEIFKLEGWYDRQLRDLKVRTAPEFALRDRLRFWFDNRKEAREEYSKLEYRADSCTACGVCLPKCPYSLDIIAKLGYTHFKLTDEWIKQRA